MGSQPTDDPSNVDPEARLQSEQGGDYEWSVDGQATSSRLDKFLLDKHPNCSRSQLQKLISSGRVLVNGKSRKPSFSLKGGESVAISIPPPPPPMPIAENIPLDIIYEDDALIAINKSPDMVVHPSPGTDSAGTIVNALLSYTDTLSKEGGNFRPGIVHRLDRETSGVMLIARTDVAHRHLSAQFKNRTVHKEYMALCGGHPKHHSGLVDQPLGRSLANRKKMSIRHDESGKESRTRWKWIRTIHQSSWIHCFPETGRTHQIRVHLKSIQLPIICDSTYGREKSITIAELLGKKKNASDEPALTRQALHARKIEFEHPLTSKRIEIEAPLHNDMQTIWDFSKNIDD